MRRLEIFDDFKTRFQVNEDTLENALHAVSNFH